jgi:acyl CoA:acetate/3-ketoacid CoA transferase
MDFDLVIGAELKSMDGKIFIKAAMKLKNEIRNRLL